MPPVERSLVSAFATPVGNWRWPDSGALNVALEQEILSREAATPGLARSNVGGWHSDTDLFRWDCDCARELAERVGSYLRGLCRSVAEEPESPAATGFELAGWANVLRQGQYNTLHSHPNAAWSGVYYVCGNPAPEGGFDKHPFSGKLELLDPRPGASLSYSEGTKLYGRFLINPVPGQMVVFPGWLQHLVHPYHGPGARITVAFNATMTGA